MAMMDQLDFRSYLLSLRKNEEKIVIYLQVNTFPDADVHDKVEIFSFTGRIVNLGIDFVRFRTDVPGEPRRTVAIPFTSIAFIESEDGDSFHEGG